jgi:hypothetical protein
MSDTPPVDAMDLATAEEAEAYDRWFRAKVKAVLDSQGPTLSHDEVMAELSATMIEILSVIHSRQQYP